jgi:Zn-dependent peptidase ImmA (M78 family)/transcriptional regulator with XRE-family HTH domain
VSGDPTIGARIRTLREAAGFQSQELARVVGLDPSAMSNIETGKRSVKSSELAKIAEALRVSPLALLDEDSLPARMPVAARAAAGAVGTGTAYPRLIALSELHQVLDDAGIARAPHLPRPPTSGLTDWKSVANNLATWVTQQLDVDEDPELRFSALADAIEDQLGVDVIVEPHPGDPLVGAAISDEKFPLIFVNADSPTPRALFTLAHELGHLLAGHGEPIAVDDDLSGRNEVERLANAFAASFLMPEANIRDVIEKWGRGAEALAQMTYQFGVSLQSLIYRLHNLQIINAPTRDRLESVGWHRLLSAIEKREVAERLGPNVLRSLVARQGDRPAYRAPGWLAERAFAGYRKGIISVRPLAGLLHVDPSELMNSDTDMFDTTSKDILNAGVTAPATINGAASDNDLYGGTPV